ncbi:hypothetical protein BGX38DRAFT_760355 [Terfezia claveryi]|nr:hypothetical protein BGX38DRAFT_760355 [Terfezia claveryi]
MSPFALVPRLRYVLCLMGLRWWEAVWAAVAPQYAKADEGSSAASDGIGFYVYKHFTILLTFCNASLRYASLVVIGLYCREAKDPSVPG